jgi:hypothetical protein
MSGSATRAEIRAQLTAGERAFLWVWMVVLCVLPTGAGCLVIFGRGTARAVGVVLLFVSLVLLAIPISPFLRRRIQTRAGQRSVRP